MEKHYLKDFDFPAKHPTEEAQLRWRNAVGIVKNPRRRFRHIVDLAKRNEQKLKVRKFQVLLLSSTF